jgi:hypothetical protein
MFKAELSRLNKEWSNAQKGKVLCLIKEIMLKDAKTGKKHIILHGAYTMPEKENICCWMLQINGSGIGNFDKAQACEMIKDLFEFIKVQELHIFQLSEDRYRYPVKLETLLEQIASADESGCDEIGDHVITWGNVENYGEDHAKPSLLLRQLLGNQ